MLIFLLNSFLFKPHSIHTKLIVLPLNLGLKNFLAERLRVLLIWSNSCSRSNFVVQISSFLLKPAIILKKYIVRISGNFLKHLSPYCLLSCFVAVWQYLLNMFVSFGYVFSCLIHLGNLVSLVVQVVDSIPQKL